MGNSQPPINTFKNKHVVIVGLSYAGFAIAEKLWDHFNVTCIDQNDYFEHICTSFKCSIDDKYHQEVLYSYDNMVKAYNNKFQFRQAKLVQVNQNDSVLIKGKEGT